jgi:mannose-6-phosphate isomerase
MWARPDDARLATDHGRIMLYPLKFKPRSFEKMWGGRKFETLLGKALPPEQPIGESWELFDFPPGVVENSPGWLSSEVANGPLAGKTLHELVKECGTGLMGNVKLIGTAGQFPVLIKFLDAKDDLSVQVHPDEQYAAAHPDAHLKTEAWYIVQHDERAKLYKGLCPGTTRGVFERAIKDGTVEKCIETLDVKPGDCVFMPSGTVHALGAGILAWEVQTPSDTTYRVFDFNRVDASTGKPRTLHIEQALACIDFSGKSPPKQSRNTITTATSTISRLVSSPYFNLDKVRARGGVDGAPLHYDQPVVWTMLEGEAHLRVSDLPEPVVITRGETVLLPARMKSPSIRMLSNCVWLEVSFPL